MEIEIELVGGPDDGDEVHAIRATAEDWPERLYVSRSLPRSIYADDTIQGRPSEAIAAAFWSYKRTERTTILARRIYEWEG